MSKRSYSKPKTKVKVVLKPCPIHKCNKKYKTEAKLIKHIEDKHYFSTRCSNYYCFSFMDKHEIYKCMIDYIQILNNCKDLTDEQVNSEITDNEDGIFVQSSIKLLPQTASDEMTQDEIVRICFGQRNFAKKLFRSTFSDNLDLTDEIIYNFNRFLNLGLPYYDTNFCPTIPIDFVWHSLMQRPDFYAEICKKTIGDILPHCIDRDEDEEIDDKRFEYFCELYKQRTSSSKLIIFEQVDTDKEVDIDKIIDHFNASVTKYMDLHNKEVEDKRLYQEKLEQERLLVAEERRKEAEKFQLWLNENEFTEMVKISWDYKYALMQAHRSGLNKEDTSDYVKRQIENKRYERSSC